MRPLLILLFAASGFAGLVYESVWAQYLRMLVGAAAYAQSLVLAGFMGGTALGAWWASRRSAEWRNLLRTYALVEVGLGLLAGEEGVDRMATRAVHHWWNGSERRCLMTAI